MAIIQEFDSKFAEKPWSPAIDISIDELNTKYKEAKANLAKKNVTDLEKAEINYRFTRLHILKDIVEKQSYLEKKFNVYDIGKKRFRIAPDGKIKMTSKSEADATVKTLATKLKFMRLKAEQADRKAQNLERARSRRARTASSTLCSKARASSASRR